MEKETKTEKRNLPDGPNDRGPKRARDETAEEESTALAPSPKKERTDLLDLFSLLPVETTELGPLRVSGENESFFTLALKDDTNREERLIYFRQVPLSNVTVLLDQPSFWVSCARESKKNIEGGMITEEIFDFHETKGWDPLKKKHTRGTYVDKSVRDLVSILRQKKANQVLMTCQVGRERSVIKIVVLHALLWNILNAKRMKKEGGQTGNLIPAPKYEEFEKVLTPIFLPYLEYFVAEAANRIRSIDPTKFHTPCTMCSNYISLDSPNALLLIKMGKEWSFPLKEDQVDVLCSRSCYMAFIRDTDS